MKHNIVEREMAKIKIDATTIVPYIDKPEWDGISVAGVAAIIASIYTGYESIFRYLCENKITKSEHWHKDLLETAIKKGFVPPATEKYYWICFLFGTSSGTTTVTSLKSQKFAKKLLSC
jgi:hypothetical protein